MRGNHTVAQLAVVLSRSNGYTVYSVYLMINNNYNLELFTINIDMNIEYVVHNYIYYLHIHRNTCLLYGYTWHMVRAAISYHG